MKTLLASTAIAMFAAGAALADAHTTMGDTFVPGVQTQALRASDLMGARLYVSEADVDVVGGLSQDWNDVGEISDIIMGNSGEVDAVIADIGGFLGIGEREVAVNMDSLKFVSDGPEADEYFVVLQGTQADLEAAPEFDPVFERGRTVGAVDMEATETETTTETAVVPAEAVETEVETTTEEVEIVETEAEAEVEAATETVEAETEAAAEEVEAEVAETETEMANTTMLTAPTMEREGYEVIARDALTTEDVTGAAVYGTDDERIGEIGELVMTTDGQLGDAIIDVGGFLGLGEKPVAVPFDSLTILRNEGDVRVYVDATQEQLEGMPEFEG